MLSGRLFVATEKVHGSNLCFIVSLADKTVKVARRRGLLDPKEKFFPGWKPLVERYSEPAVRLAEKVADRHNENENITSVIIYGEMFGGFYEDSNTSSIRTRIENGAIQTEILYRPEIEFYLFDIALAFQTQAGNKNRIYLSYLEMVKCVEAQAEDFPFWARPIMIGSREQMFQFPVDTFTSTVAVPSKQESMVEGIIIQQLSSSSLITSEGRVICKYKAERFLEAVDEHRGPKHDKLPTGEESSWGITLNRLDAIISKSGRLPKNKMSELVHSFVADVLEDFEDAAINNPGLYGQVKKFIEKSEDRWIEV